VSRAFHREILSLRTEKTLVAEPRPGYSVRVKTVLLALVVVLVVALGLALSIPDEASFHSHLASVDQADGDDSLLHRAGESLGRTQAKLTADYRHHLLWATVEITRGAEKQRWVGALGMWFRLPESDEG
jgi:hypothetical protein